MANINSFSVRDQFYDTGSAFDLPSAFTTTSVTETAFLLANTQPSVISIPTGTAIAGSTANTSVSGSSAILGVSSRQQNIRGNNQRPYFTAKQFDGRPFRICAQGYVSGGGTTLTSVTAAIGLYIGTSATLGSDTAIAKPTAFSCGNINGNWMFEGRFIWDSVSQTVNGSYFFQGINATPITCVLATQTTGITIAGLNFLFSWSFATSSTANTIGCTSMFLDQV